MKSIFKLAVFSVCVPPLLAQQATVTNCKDERQLDEGRCWVINDDGNEVAVRPCSTEKVNGESCALVFNRQYPVTLPTIQMAPGKRVFVLMENPLEFETLSLDLTSATALPGTEQFASLVTAAVPQLKGFEASNVASPAQGAFTAQAVQGGVDQLLMDAIDHEVEAMKAILATANTALPDDKTNPMLYQEIRVVYEQLNQAMAPIPKPGSGGSQFATPPDAQHTPDPWSNYADWRNCLIYELVGGNKDGVRCNGPTDPHDPSIPSDFKNALGDIGTMQGRLPSTPPAPAPTNPVFDQGIFEGLMKHIKSEISNLKTQENKDSENATLDELQRKENDLLARIAVLTATLTNVQKDFVTYYQNILMATHALPTPREVDWKSKDEDKDKDKCEVHRLYYTTLGEIDDPLKLLHGSTPGLYGKFLGRSVVYAINTINNIATARISVAATTAKVSLATVTVLYSNPRLESSAGAIISFVHNRTFANQTITNPPAGSDYTPGEIVIAQMKTDPEVVPFVALHMRMTDEYLMPDHRRGAVYGSIWVGLNPYSVVPEYGAGPTFSWRSLMFSLLYNRAHQTSLISGESVGTPICSPTPPAGSTLPPCTPAPPAPITRTTGLNAFAIGLSVRIPTSFAAGTGGVSR